nr:C-type lectin 37Da-like [Drosophila kikkawai]
MVSGLCVLVFLGLFSQFLAIEITPTISDGVPETFNITRKFFEHIGNGYYYIEKVKSLNWFAAFESCRQVDAHLVAFESLEEWNSVILHLKNNKIEGIFWTSGTDLANQEEHVWFTTGQKVTLDSIWNEGEPNNDGGNEHCDVVLSAKDSIGLNDLECELKRLYICEAPQPITASFVIW